MAASRRKQKGEDFKQEDVLQAVLIAESFNKKFAPITKQKPKVLLPLANIPLLEYTLEFLCASGIQEVILFCCSHANQIKSYLAGSKWGKSQSPMEILTLVSEDCLSVGDALRDIDAKSLISNDFVLVTGDIISNVQLKPILEAHKARRLKDKKVLMTMLFKNAPPGHMIRCKEDEVAMAVRPDNKQVLSYHKMGSTKSFDLPLTIFTDTGNKNVQLRYDLLDSHISICSAHVPQMFTDNFDFLTCDDFVRGILVDEEILGNTIHIHELEAEYAARVSNLQMYDAISKDVLNRWVYPLVPDNTITEQSTDKYCYGRHNIYLHSDVTLARGCILQENVLIGKGSDVSKNTSITHSIIGKNCNIGENVKLDGVYIWDDVQIEDNCALTTCVVDSAVHLKQNVTVLPGSVLGAGVIVGPNVALNPSTMLSAEPPENDFDSDIEDEAVIDVGIVGEEGRGYVFRLPADSDSEGEVPVTDAWGVEIESDDAETASVSSDAFSEDRDSPVQDEPKLFYGEVIGTLQRAREENISKDNIVLEINSLKHAYGIQIKEVNHLLTKAIMELPLDSCPNLEPAQYLSQVKSNFDKFVLPLLRNYIRNTESQMDCLLSLEDFSINNMVGQKSLVNVVHYLYDKELLSEEVILSWHENPSGDENGPAKKLLRNLVNPFISWLQEAEEESDEDDSDE